MQLDLELYREEAEVESGVRISVIDVAPDRPNRTLVLIHGFGGRARQWRYQIEQFAVENRVIAIDLRGHGRSSRPAAGYEMGRILADISAVLESRGVSEPIVLIGHSFGVGIVTEFATTYPDKVSHLILIAGAGEYKIAWQYRIGFKLPEAALGLLQPFFNGFLDASLRALKEFYKQNMRLWSGWEKFPLLKPPTMVILGNRDRVLPQEAFERVAELVPPESEVINVGVSAHMVMLERRDAVNRAIERFLDQSPAPNSHSRWRTNKSDGVGSLLAERPWLAHYESDIPRTIHIPRLPLTRLLDRAWRRFPKSAAISFHGTKLSYSNLSAQAGRFANALQALGAVKGTRVMLLLPNLPQLVIAYYGTLRLGGIVVMVSPLAGDDEIVRQAQQSGSEVLVTLTRFEKAAAAVKAQSKVRHVVFAAVSDYLPPHKRILYRLRGQVWKMRLPLSETDFVWTKLLRRYPPAPPQVDVSADDLAVIQFTSGTTDDPKGITLTHRNLVANTLQTRSWMPSAQDGKETLLCVVPFSHVYGMTTGMNVSVALGAKMVLLPTFDTEQVLQTIKQTRPTLFPGVPSMYMAINNFPGVRKYDIQSVRACISGAAPLPVEVKEAFEKLTKGKLVEGYGLSEASPVTHANPIHGRNKAGFIGLPLPNTEARVVSLSDGRPLASGQVGELVVRGPQIMGGGYWEDGEATKAAIDQNGWLHTNDIARMDEDGYFQIISRRQDMWQDENEMPAFPRDVEEVIYELPEVLEVVVVAIANKPIAFVSLNKNVRIPPKTVIAFCQRRLPENHVPRLVIFVKEFPRNFVGKVLRRELVSQWEIQIKAEAGSVGDHLPGLERP